jgi:hypothetical protein
MSGDVSPNQESPEKSASCSETFWCLRAISRKTTGTFVVGYYKLLLDCLSDKAYYEAKGGSYNYNVTELKWNPGVKFGGKESNRK